MKNIYQATNEKAAREALKDFKAAWDAKYPMVSKSWEAKWELLTKFLAYPLEIRTITYTTNTINSHSRILLYTTQKII